MPEGYDSHADYMAWVKSDADARQAAITGALVEAFAPFVEKRQVDVIHFGAMTVMDLAQAILAYPAVLKALLACGNVAARAIERDLDIRGIDTYAPRLSEAKAGAIAAYLKPFLPREVPVPALSELDRVFFVDKEIRARKGRWERMILDALNRQSRMVFRKRRFDVGGESFELDAAAPTTGPIEIGVDVKRIEARRDIHKRADEIINKAVKFRTAFPKGRFAVVVYYPFTSEHVNVQSRLESPDIEAVCFASQSPEQICIAVGLLVDRLGLRKR
ncbi:MAG TPA: hypothetical protein PLC79_00390 [Phycisphaerae bacterium]|nr:hypothetical protein [Phycisphaerae bacterium]